MKKLEYSKVARRKLKELKAYLIERFGEETSKKCLSEITQSLRRLEQFSDSGVDISQMYDVDTDYYYVVINQNYFIYRIFGDRVIVVNIFNEKEDFIQKLFGISGRSQESIDYWGE